MKKKNTYTITSIYEEVYRLDGKLLSSEYRSCITPLKKLAKEQLGLIFTGKQNNYNSVYRRIKDRIKLGYSLQQAIKTVLWGENK